MLSRTPLLDPVVDHDACGVGFVAQMGAGPSHETVERALEALRRLAHRGGLDADGYSGDGAGLLTAIPERFMRRTAREQGINLPQEFAVGMVFLPRHLGSAARETIATLAPQFGIACLGWRHVPVNDSISGHRAVETLPLIEQCYFRAEAGVDFDRALFRFRKSVETAIAGVYFCSLSTRTIVYKGLLTPQQLPLFYGDLTDPEFESRFAIFHQRYSTNTQPSWSMAQPFRLVAHNGEINTIRGNRRWLRAREPRLRNEFEILSDARLFESRVSDSSTFDNAFEVRLQRGDMAGEAMLSMVPPAWENDAHGDADVRRFLAARAPECEPCDGPAALIFSDGRVVGAKLDRNGLRPCRYTLTSDGWLIVGSETGIADLHDKHVDERQRLGPGQMLLLDLETGALHRPTDTPPVRLSQPVTAAPQRVAPTPQHPSLPKEKAPALMAALGWTEDQFKMLFQPLAQQGKEAVWSMGDDTPPAALSKQRRALWDYCKQRFAQVTNPAIDPFREAHVMSLDVYFGARTVLPSPLLDEGQLRTLNTVVPPTHVVDFTFPAADGVTGAEAALARVRQDAARAAAKHRGFLLLTDRNTGVERAALPAMLALAAAWKSLASAPNMPVVVETGQAFDTHHVAMLVAAGASAVYPWLAFAHASSQPDGTANYRKSVETGLRKVLARMGISAIASYRNSQLFETIGLDPELCGEFFENADCALGGVSLHELLQETVERHQEAFAAGVPMRDAGLYRFRHAGEQHASSPELVRRLHKFVKLPTAEHRRSLEQLASEHEPVTIRDYLEIVSREPVSLQEVESEASVLSRFSTQAMSLGAISPEAHRTLAIAMNRLGARSNTGEGGEDPALYRDLREAANRVKQVASARFGVTAEYLSQADELEIKISQGSKPGEGGQLPASKVTAYIARLRHAVPNMQLISPPPHHDIYSIEDLAQLIYDLRAVNPRARIGVKLVSSAGVGIIAAGVAKAGANVITIAGHDGGTGASPLTSIKNTGMPWEIGLRETHATLLRTGLRGRVRLRADGGFKFARDVIIAALLGAEEFGFGTAALLAIGCVMARQCHLNTCPVGVATQDEKLRTRFSGTPEMVENYFRGLAAEVRERLAAIGARSLDEIVGAVERLRPREESDSSWVQPLLDSSITPGQQIPAFREIPGRLIRQLTRTVGEADSFGSGRRRFVIANSDRAIGAHLSGEVLRRRDEPILGSGPREYEFIGTAGQSFGAFLVAGLNFRLIGQANDYVGKGLSGGSIAISAGEEASRRGDVLAGNTVLYGATSGELYLAGRAGERFAVRNSGAFAVVEGLGQHGCEYMTGGIVLVLGSVGKNFGAGMTGGLAYVLREHVSQHLLNGESVRLAEPEMPEELWLRWALQRHAQLTGSPVAERLLQHEGPVPLARVEPLQPSTTVADTWQAVLRRVQKSRQVPVDAITEPASAEPTLM
jgi:glutamate synthase (ferredoxin)